MRHFWPMIGAVAGNFILWALITILPVPAIIIFGLAIAVGCLMFIRSFGHAAEKWAGREGLIERITSESQS